MIVTNRTFSSDAKNPKDGGICESCPLKRYAPTEQCLDCSKAKEFYKNLRPIMNEMTAAEVEQLKAENEQNAAYAEIYKDICDKYGKNFGALLDKAKALQTENVTLKKALELAFKNNSICPYLANHLPMPCRGKKQNTPCNEKCVPDYFIHQAEQSSDEVTHGEAEESEAERKR